MRDARYLRQQAKLCLDIANQLSDRAAAEKFRADAADYHARAAEIENGERQRNLSADSKKPDDKSDR